MSQGRGLVPGKFLVPARDSRHRTACLALYRALLRLAPKVSLPADLATGWTTSSSSDGRVIRNPIAEHVSRAFRRNRADVSPRIVHAALDAGYRMLTVLQSAAAAGPGSGSPHHDSVTSFLAARLAERNRSLKARSEHIQQRGPRRPDPAAPRPGTLPLLVSVSPPPTRANPSPRPAYATPHRPRPLDALGGTGRRKVPRLEMASDFPFLRLTKPQPALLSRVLRQKLLKRAARAVRFKELGADAMPDAQAEDDWEVIVAEQAAREEKRDNNEIRSNNNNKEKKNSNKDPRKRNSDAGADEASSFGNTVHRHGVVHLSEVLSRERVDQVARSDAFRRLIAQEKALAAQEKAQRAAQKRSRWEARMREEHGERWRDLFPNLKESGGSEGRADSSW
ncbi:hypothetical protein F5Y14DRAFT_67048 [Nemania sp. NC0429]|nr:hypothetical protein F5Y14DRAFT_67048 [Nemania sp. NC0429]